VTSLQHFSHSDVSLPLSLLCAHAGDSKAQGGDLGWITPGLMVPEFDAAAFFFPVGELATTKSEFGWHVLRVAEASYVSPEMQPLELKERLAEATETNGGLQLVDLRGEEELKEAPLLPGFRHLPYTQWQTWAPDAIDGALEPPLRSEAEVVFMDHRGGRGERMMQYLAQNGFTSARFVRGGINAYAEEVSDWPPSDATPPPPHPPREGTQCFFSGRSP
jgi:rhodanese-related sulfurtransferase